MRTLMGWLVVGSAMIMGGFMYVFWYKPEQGVRLGILMALRCAEDGSCKGELYLGSYQEDGQLSETGAGVWRFQMTNPPEHLHAQELIGAPVRVYYRLPRLSMPWQQQNSLYEVYRIEQVGQKPRIERIFMRRQERDSLEQKRKPTDTWPRAD